jgi:hypothetical protein
MPMRELWKTEESPEIAQPVFRLRTETMLLP